MSHTPSDPTRAPYDKRTALATLVLASEFINDAEPADWDGDRTREEVVADFLRDLRVKIVTSEHWRKRLIELVAEEKR